MSYGAAFKLPPALPEMSRKVAIVGLGETDYNLDYAAARARAPGYEAPTAEGLAEAAFDRALADSGLARADIDGLVTSFLYGGPSPGDLAGALGINPRHLATNPAGIMAGPLPAACAAIASGACDTVALIYSVATRSIGRTFGGQVHQENAAPSSYYYHHPWGWSSQAAHWAFIWSHYQATYGATEEDLGAVAIQMRNNAMTTPHAIMRKPLGMETYLASRYVVRPLHLFDLCLVNDGAVCLVVSRADKARDLPHTPVLLGGWGEASVKADKLEALVRGRLRPQFQKAGQEALDMAGLSLADVQHFEGYDASTIHLINHIEGHGFVEPGAGLDFCKQGEMAVGGKLPVNVAGGMLSGSYMHGWNHVAEITRQLRHEAGSRQIDDLQVSMFSLAQTDHVHPLIFIRGE